MRIGVIDLLVDSPQTWIGRHGYGLYVRKQFMSIMPQVVAVWCRSLGHEVHYATYWGQCDPLSLVPDEIDVIFIAAYTQNSALAYALSQAFKKRRTLTVLGGPHAMSFPTDSSRFFDIVVEECDRALIDDILHRRFDPPAIVSTNCKLQAFPTIQERMPEIRIASFHRGRPVVTSIVPMLASVGCPYSCNFCVDWNTDYAPLPLNRLRTDLEYLSLNFPGLIIVYHDPNFAIRFDETMDVIAGLPKDRRNRYMMESSLSVLKDKRIARLSETNCLYIAPGSNPGLTIPTRLEPARMPDATSSKMSSRKWSCCPDTFPESWPISFSGARLTPATNRSCSRENSSKGFRKFGQTSIYRRRLAERRYMMNSTVPAAFSGICRSRSTSLHTWQLPSGTMTRSPTTAT